MAQPWPRPLLHLRHTLQAKIMAPNKGLWAVSRAVLAHLSQAIAPMCTRPHDTAVALYSEAAQLLAPGVDLILCETVSSLAHARAILQGAQAAGLPVWLSVTVDDADGTCLRSGERVADLAQILELGAGTPTAILANCSSPEAIGATLAILAGFGLPFGAYANGFQQITPAFLQENPTVDGCAQCAP